MILSKINVKMSVKKTNILKIILCIDYSNINIWCEVYLLWFSFLNNTKKRKSLNNKK